MRRCSGLCSQQVPLLHKPANACAFDLDQTYPTHCRDCESPAMGGSHTVREGAVWSLDGEVKTLGGPATPGTSTTPTSARTRAAFAPSARGALRRSSAARPTCCRLQRWRAAQPRRGSGARRRCACRAASTPTSQVGARAAVCRPPCAFSALCLRRTHLCMREVHCVSLAEFDEQWFKEIVFHIPSPSKHLSGRHGLHLSGKHGLLC